MCVRSTQRKFNAHTAIGATAALYQLATSEGLGLVTVLWQLLRGLCMKKADDLFTASQSISSSSTFLNLNFAVSLKERHGEERH